MMKSSQILEKTRCIDNQYPKLQNFQKLQSLNKFNKIYFFLYNIFILAMKMDDLKDLNYKSRLYKKSIGL